MKVGAHEMKTGRVLTLSIVLAALALAGAPRFASAHDPDAQPATQNPSEHGSLADVGAKLSNPASDVWALFTEFGVNASDGDANTGNQLFSGNLTFQPILPVPLYGEGENEWKLIVRPTIPVLFGNPVPDPNNFNHFDRQTGLGDMLLPLPLIPRRGTGSWDLGRPSRCRRPPRMPSAGSSGPSVPPGSSATRRRSGWP